MCIEISLLLLKENQDPFFLEENSQECIKGTKYVGENFNEQVFSSLIIKKPKQWSLRKEEEREYITLNIWRHNKISLVPCLKSDTFGAIVKSNTTPHAILQIVF